MDPTLAQFDGPGPVVDLGGTTARFLHEGAEISVTALDLAPGFPGPVPHRHRAMTDSFYVVAGRPSFLVGDAWRPAEPSTWVSVPPGTVHTFRNDTAERVRLLNVMAPGGLEQYLKEVAAASEPGAPPGPARMAAIAARYDFVPA